MSNNEIVEQYGTKISCLARRMISNPELVKDACQEVWYEVFKSINSFKADSDISTWIYTIAKRTFLRVVKNDKIVTHSDIDQCVAKGQVVYDDPEENKEEWIKEKCDDCITAFCHCLTSEARMIFLFRENLDLSYEQIAQIMDMPVENIRQITSRSLKKVKSFMMKDCILVNPHGRCGCRIKNVIKSIDYDKKYIQLEQAKRLVDFYKKFEIELPRKNYWKKFLDEVVTN